MSKNAAEKLPESKDELAQIREDLRVTRGLIADMALLFVPPALRQKCDCGRIACRKITAQKPGITGFNATDRPGGEPEPRTYVLCDACQMPDGWQSIGALELGPVERETVRLANKLIIAEPKA